MLKLNTKQRLHDMKGEVLKDGADQAEVTVGLIITNILSASKNNPHRCYILAKKIAENETVDLKAEDVVFIEERLTESGLSALISGQAIELLESPSSNESKEEGNA